MWDSKKYKKMNKKGSATFYVLMLGIVVFLLGLYLAPTVSEFTTNAMGNSTGEFGGLDCDNSTDVFIKSTCIVTDMSLFYFIGSLIFIAFAVATARIIFLGGETE